MDRLIATLWVGGVTGWFLGLSLVCLVNAGEIGHPPGPTPGFALMNAEVLTPPVCAALGAAVAWVLQRRADAPPLWRPGSGLLLAGLLNLTFGLCCWRFWQSVPAEAEIRPMGWAAFCAVISVVSALGGLALGLAESLTPPGRTRWHHIILGLLAVGVSLLPWWVDLWISGHFQHLKHFKFED